MDFGWYQKSNPASENKLKKGRLAIIENFFKMSLENFTKNDL